ncbi:TPA: DUF3800 domain-containing protein [Staphylococcus aureus]|uniref:DUF3800 domain-containing protein n=1 Tax=Staphylococcus aureus TaxID=1280 RepID=UPI001C148AC8|nr:DUF3800 domain-containing protein [Staphylococcus aureus]EKV6571945.1 DUF3800 domain-containing protein [Staphylococcus aureus]EKW9247556.1 DUF3800 domain-containing protein [Staphylococcus aureus]EKW9254332.1 DUF3800 domain-containing protein [Staphylococcus aureus]HAY1815157.1 DUF3800 domain-containing protein [Staphylococcus aureus]
MVTFVRHYVLSRKSKSCIIKLIKKRKGNMVMGEKFLYIDDSGQLSDNGTHEYFIYSGVFIENKNIINELKRRVNGLAKVNKIKGEFKGSELGGRHRRKLLKIIDDTDGVHTFFVVEKTSLLTRVDFENPQKVRYHKNYLIRRLIEEIIEQSLVSDSDFLYTYIDNEASNDTNQAEHLNNHLNEYWKLSSRGLYYKHSVYGQFIPRCDVNIKVKYLDSKHERMIQLADILANSKYKRFSNKKGCHSELIHPKRCLKLPEIFFSPKNDVYNS